MEFDIRWNQRFSNYEKAFLQLTEFIEKLNLNKFEIQGLIQCFEYTFELGWKTMKDYLENEGFNVKTPRDTIQIAFQSELISDGHAWIDALEKRNLMSHTYNEEISNQVSQLIYTKYYAVLKDLYHYLKQLENMKYGLSNEDLTYIINTVKQFEEIEKAIIFGSRVKGNYKKGSDIDIAIVGKDITIDTVANLQSELADKSLIPYLFDVVDFKSLDNEKLIDHIKRIGETIFERG